MKNEYPGSWYQPLFDLMYNEHNRIMLQTEMDDIIEVVHKMLNSDKEPERSVATDVPSSNVDDQLKKICDLYGVPPELLKPSVTILIK